jgi:hypothetical protein
VAGGSSVRRRPRPPRPASSTGAPAPTRCDARASQLSAVRDPSLLDQQKPIDPAELALASYLLADSAARAPLTVSRTAVIERSGDAIAVRPGRADRSGDLSLRAACATPSWWVTEVALRHVARQRSAVGPAAIR